METIKEEEGFDWEKEEEDGKEEGIKIAKVHYIRVKNCQKN